MRSFSDRFKSPVIRPDFPPDDLEDKHATTRRAFIIGVGAAGLGVAAYAGTHARHELEVTERTFRIKNLPDSFRGYRIAQLSDIHLEEYTEPFFLEEAVRRINVLNPDVVLLTGDFVSRGPRSLAFSMRMAGLCAEILQGLTAPHRYGVLGNHDAMVDAVKIPQILKDHGTQVLVDEYIALERGGERIWLSGAQDPGVLGSDLNKCLPAAPDAPVIYMCHEPDFADKILDHPKFSQIDLMLSGHTHGGQIRLPIAGPLVLPSMGKHYISGHYQLKGTQLYVNRGLGTVGLPFRLNCPAEITHITLERA